MKLNAMVLLVSQVVSAVSKFLVFIVFAQLGGVETAGVYSLGLSVVTPTFLLFGLSLRTLFVTQHESASYPQFFSVRIFSGIAGVVVVSLLGIIFFPELWLLFCALGAYRFSELLVELRIASFQRAHHIRSMALSTIVFSIVSLCAMGVAFILSENIVLSVFAAASAGCIVYLVLLPLSPREAREMITAFSWKSSKRVVMHGSSLSLSVFLVAMSTSLPVLLLARFESAELVGIYAAIYNVTTLGNIVYSSISQLYLRDFTVQSAGGNFKRLRIHGLRLVFCLTAVGVVALPLIYLFGVPVFSWVFGVDFGAFRLELVIMALALCLSPWAFVLDAQLAALHEYSGQVVVALASLCFCILVSVQFVSSMSVLGAVIAVLLTLLARNCMKTVIFLNASRS